MFSIVKLNRTVGLCSALLLMTAPLSLQASNPTGDSYKAPSTVSMSSVETLETASPLTLTPLRFDGLEFRAAPRTTCNPPQKLVDECLARNNQKEPGGSWYFDYDTCSCQPE